MQPPPSAAGTTNLHDAGSAPPFAAAEEKHHSASKATVAARGIFICLPVVFALGFGFCFWKFGPARLFLPVETPASTGLKQVPGQWARK